MRINKYIFFLIVAWMSYGQRLPAQVLPVGTPELEDYYRRMQLTGVIDSSLSFVIRPLTSQGLLHKDVFNPKQSEHHYNGIADSSFRIKPLPLITKLQYTSSFPTGWNDGGMIPTVGAQTYLSGGIYASYKWISIQLQPEFVFASNRSYTGFDGDTEASWVLWYQYANNIDMPERFGTGPYYKILPGQSSIRFNYNKLSLGFSTENLWWGPGRRNSLLMSNTAPGFPHLTLNTTAPLRSPIGSFEGQLAVGRLQGSGYPPTDLSDPNHYGQHYVPKPDGWRYFSGFVLSYQPKWLTGLSIGASRSFVMLGSDWNIGHTLPFFGPGNVDNPDAPGGIQTGEQKKKSDEYKSVFARWVMPKGKLEFYVEYGRNDPGWDSRDRFIEMDHTRAYIFGFRKLLPIYEADDEFIDVGMEITQLGGTRTSRVRSSPSWYSSNIVRHGYTQLGQALGAGVGPGGSLQTLNIAWVKRLKKLGIQFERQEHQLDFFYDAVIANGDFRKNWVDMSVRLNGAWDYKQFIFFGDLWFIKALNYQNKLVDLPNNTGDNFWNFTRKDKLNFQANLGLMYRF